MTGFVEHEGGALNGEAPGQADEERVIRAVALRTVFGDGPVYPLGHPFKEIGAPEVPDVAVDLERVHPDDGAHTARRPASPQVNQCNP